MTNNAMPAANRVQLEDDIVVINDFLIAQGYSDGLPVIPPTLERVEEMVQASGRPANELVATLPPAQGQATVQKIAINAVMAGCRPEYMPVVIAAIEAMLPPPYNLSVAQVTTHPAAPMLIVNGPIRKELSMNWGTNALGQGNRANATIGRAVRLALVNLGGASPGVDKSTQGQPARYSFCFAENEEENPWEPLHVEYGLKPGESAVTVVSAAGTHHLGHGSDDGEDLLKSLTSGIVCTSNNHLTAPGSEPVLLLCPAHAKLLANCGYTKAKLKKHFYEYARVPVASLSEYTLKRRRQAGHSVEPETSVPMTRRWEDFLIAVVGGDGGLHSTFVPTLGPSKAITQRIRKPAA